MWLTTGQAKATQLGILPLLIPLVATGLTVGAQAYQAKEAERKAKKEQRRQIQAELEAQRLAKEQAARDVEVEANRQWPGWLVPALAMGGGLLALGLIARASR